MIVVARGKEDISYLSIYLPDIPHTVYQVGASPIPLRQMLLGICRRLRPFQKLQHSSTKHVEIS